MQYQVHKYLIIMNDWDDFVISIKQNVNRSNNPDDDDLIREYMNKEYYGHKYRAIDLDCLEYFNNIEI